MNMDSDAVRLFVLAAEKLNISAAGRALGMSPAMASAKLAKLERTLGADLLHRTTRHVALSTEGEDFLPYAREILAQEDAAMAALGLTKAEPSGTLRFAASSTFAQLYIMPLVPDFRRQYPDITLDLRLSDTQFDLIGGSFDLALRNQALDDSSLKARKLCDDVRILCASPDYLARHGTPEKPSDLTGHHLIAFQSQNARTLVGQDGGVDIFDPSTSLCRLIVDDGLSQKTATLAGAGISMNALWAVNREIADGSLERVLPNYEVDDRTALWLVYPKSNVLTAKVRVLIDFLVERIGGQKWLNE